MLRICDYERCANQHDAMIIKRLYNKNIKTCCFVPFHSNCISNTLKSSRRLSNAWFRMKQAELQHVASIARVSKLFIMFGWIFVQFACLSIALATSQQTSSQTSLGATTTTTLPAGYNQYPNINAAFKVHRERRNWSDAKQACVSEGGRLAVVDTQEKIQYVKANKPRFTDSWVGIIRDNSHWVTADDHPLRSDLPWESNRPDGFGDCAVVNVRGDGLCNKVCIWRRTFVCEILTTTTVHQAPIVISI